MKLWKTPGRILGLGLGLTFCGWHWRFTQKTRGELFGSLERGVTVSRWLPQVPNLFMSRLSSIPYPKKGFQPSCAISSPTWLEQTCEKLGLKQVFQRGKHSWRRLFEFRWSKIHARTAELRSDSCPRCPDQKAKKNVQTDVPSNNICERHLCVGGNQSQDIT